MHQHVVNDPGRHALQAVGEPDGAFGGRAGAPPAVLIGDPSHAHRLGATPEIARRQGGSPYRKRILRGRGARAQPGLASIEPPQHVGDPPLLLRSRQAGRHQHHRAVAVAVGRDGPPPVAAAHDVDARVRGHGHDARARRCERPPRLRALGTTRPHLFVLHRPPGRNCAGQSRYARLIPRTVHRCVPRLSTGPVHGVPTVSPGLSTGLPGEVAGSH